MKKRFPAIILALVLSLAPAVPALAAEKPAPPRPEVRLDLPDGHTAEEKTETFQVRSLTCETVEEPRETYVRTYDIYTYDEEPSAQEFTVTPLPLGTKLVIDGLYPEAGGWFALRLNAWSGGDGVYDQRIFYWEANPAYSTTDYELIPAAEKGPFSEAKIIADGYSADANPETLYDFDIPRYNAGQTLATTSYILYELFGPNTLLQFTTWYVGYDEESGYYKNEPETLACFLIGEKEAPGFTDLRPDAYYLDAVDWAVAAGVAKGTSDAAFSPSKTCTHGEILTFLWQAMGKPESEAQPSFAVEPGAYYEKAVKWAFERDLIGAGFDPGTLCTRADAVRYIWLAFYQPWPGANSFADVPADADYAPAVSWAVGKGVTNGTGNGMFSPDKVCNRGEIVTFLHRAFVPAFQLR